MGAEEAPKVVAAVAETEVVKAVVTVAVGAVP